jgi:hypothetical protein
MLSHEACGVPAGSVHFRSKSGRVSEKSPPVLWEGREWEANLGKLDGWPPITILSADWVIG